MRYKLQAYAIWEYGQRTDAQGNPHQEDSLYPIPEAIDDTDNRLFIICDGMGGHDAGEVASATVCQAISSSIKRNCPTPESHFTKAMLQEAIKSAFDALDAIGSTSEEGSGKKMGTTLAMLDLAPEGAFVAHMGDSRVYQIRPAGGDDEARLMFRTSDHSLVNELVNQGLITPEEALHHPKRNVITRALQPMMSPRPSATLRIITDIRPGDYFYICSDGMLEQMEDHNLVNILSMAEITDEEKVEMLRTLTAENRDNHTAFLIHITDVEGAPAVAPEESADKACEVGSPTPPPPPASNGEIQAKGHNVTPKSQGLSNHKVIILGSAVIAVLLAVAALIFLPGKCSRSSERDSDDDSGSQKTEKVKQTSEDAHDKTTTFPASDKPAPNNASIDSNNKTDATTSFTIQDPVEVLEEVFDGLTDKQKKQEKSTEESTEKATENPQKIQPQILPKKSPKRWK